MNASRIVRRGAVWLLLMPAIFASCSYQQPDSAEPPAVFIPIAELDYESFAKIITNADRFELFEGLPHQRYELQLLKRELDEKQTIDRGGFHFYREPLQVTAADAEMLTSCFASKKAFAPVEPGHSKCGEYHPDFALQWSKGDEEVFVQICLGCGECKVFREPQRIYLMLDFDLYAKLKANFKDRQNNRPETPFTDETFK